MEFAVGLLALAVTYLAWRNGRTVRENTERMLQGNFENTERIIKVNFENTERILKANFENTEKILKANSENTERILLAIKDGFKILGRILVAETPEEKRKLAQQLENL